MKLRRGVAAIALAVAMGCEAPEAKAPAPAAAPPPEDQSAVFSRVLPGVVLVVTQRADGQTGFGAAILLPGNLALTNRHVIEGARSIQVMFYDPKRASHGGLAEEGGLRRYLFENEKALVPAERTKDDPLLDLAVIRFEGDTSAYPRLEWRAEPAKIGERVYAVGHPGQNVWSFTTGLVSNTHVKAIQVDAAINEGNSGGPLIDAKGRVLGINTLRALGGTQNIGYARPVALARPIVEGAKPDEVIDLSTPEKAVTACRRAEELASVGWADCSDLESMFELTSIAQDRALAEVGSPSAVAEHFLYERTHPPVEDLVENGRKFRVAFIRGDNVVRQEAMRESKKMMQDARANPPHGPNPWVMIPRSQLRRVRDRSIEAARQWREGGPVLQATIIKRTNLQDATAHSMSTVKSETLKMGQRIEKIATVDSTHAWVAIAGLNKDGSRYQFSQLWVQRGGKWREVRIPFPPGSSTLPAGFPPTPYDPDQFVAHHALSVLGSWLPMVSAALGEPMPDPSAPAPSAKPAPAKPTPRKK